MATTFEPFRWHCSLSTADWTEAARDSGPGPGVGDGARVGDGVGDGAGVGVAGGSGAVTVKCRSIPGSVILTSLSIRAIWLARTTDRSWPAGASSGAISRIAKVNV